MARPSQSEAMQGNMAESLARRPSIAIGSAPGGQARQFEGRTKLNGACEIAVDRIMPDPGQPRTEFDPEAIDRLAASLKVRGQLQPCRVRWVEEEGRYMIVVGERRWRAAQQAGLASIACVVVQDGASREDILEDQIIENALRDDLKPVEMARAWRTLMDARGLSHRELAERLNVDHGTVTRALGLLNLPERIQASVDAGEIRAQTAYELSRVEDPEEQATLAEEAKAGRLKRDDLRDRVKASKPPKKGRGVAKGKAKLKTSVVLRTSAGVKITAERTKGLDAAVLLGAAEEWIAKLRAELQAQRTEDAA
jgi:ParB family transcriptional regulator, chromosome partitioning protein